MDKKDTAGSGLVPVHVGHAAPSPTAEAPEVGAGVRQSSRRHPRDASVRDPSIAWRQHGVEPRWLGMESSDCAAAVGPGIFHNGGAEELDRFLAGAKARHEIALVLATIGDEDDDALRNVFGGADASVHLPGLVGSISGRRLPSGARASLARDVAGADRDLGLRLLNRKPDAPWWALSLSGLVEYSGAGGPPTRREPGGRLEPILVDGMGDPVVAAWSSAPGDQRWYVIPDATEWRGILDWMVQQALQTYVPDALRRARSPHAHDPALQTPSEAAARSALDDLDAAYRQERQRLEGELERTSVGADKVRYGLLYGTGGELVEAVASVLGDAGFATVDLDADLGETSSADLLATHGTERRLVEVKSVSGRASEALVGYIERHLETWPHLQPSEAVTGGVLVVNHQHRLQPHEREPDVYSRPEFVAALTVPVLATRQLFDWWRDSDWTAIRDAVLGQDAQRTEARSTTQSLHPRPAEQAPKVGRRRWWRSLR